jgi:hypothetical protein
MADITVGYAMTVGGASTGQAAIGVDIPGLYRIDSPGDREAIFCPLIASVTGVAAAATGTLIISDDIDDVTAGGSSVASATPTFPKPQRGKIVIPFQTPGGALDLADVDYPTDGTVYLLVIGGAAVFGYLTFKWVLPSVRANWPQTVYENQAATGSLLTPEKSETWVERMRQLPAPWTETRRRYPNQRLRPPPPSLYESQRAETLAQGTPDTPRTKTSRQSRG